MVSHVCVIDFMSGFYFQSAYFSHRRDFVLLGSKNEVLLDIFLLPLEFN